MILFSSEEILGADLDSKASLHTLFAHRRGLQFLFHFLVFHGHEHLQSHNLCKGSVVFLVIREVAGLNSCFCKKTSVLRIELSFSTIKLKKIFLTGTKNNGE